MTKPNLNKLAEELSLSDGPIGKNLDVVDVRVVLAALGKKLRSVTAVEAIQIIAAIAERGGTM